jgi:prolyl oligopeptidase PreP (S9A serine peptidase family)
VKIGFSLSCACLLAVGGGSVLANDAGAPPAESHQVTDTLHGVTVTDPYRWLEKSRDPKVVQWAAAQDKRTRQYLDAIPQRAAIYKRLFRDNPAHSRKMAAALQSATTSGHPILLSIDTHAGHGIGSSLSSQVNKEADDIAFLFDQLGMQMQ